MSNSESHGIAPGRPIVLEPVAPGIWLIIGGTTIAVLGPLFGFLIGTMMGPSESSNLDPIYLFLFIGIVIGGIGTAMVLLGLWKVFSRARRNPERPSEDE